MGAAGAASAVASGGIGGSDLGGIGFGPVNTAATMASYPTAVGLAHSGEGFTKDQLKTEIYLGAAVTPVLYEAFSYLGTITDPITYAIAFATFLLPFTGFVKTTQYLIGKYNPWTYVKGIFTLEPIKDLYHVATKIVPETIKSGLTAGLFLGPITAAISTFVPAQYMVATLAPVRTAFRYILEKTGMKKEESINDNVPAPQPA